MTILGYDVEVLCHVLTVGSGGLCPELPLRDHIIRADKRHNDIHRTLIIFTVYRFQLRCIYRLAESEGDARASLAWADSRTKLARLIHKKTRYKALLESYTGKWASTQRTCCSCQVKIVGTLIGSKRELFGIFCFICKRKGQRELVK